MKTILSKVAYEKLFTWIDHAKGECSGMGIVQIVDDAFLVKDIFICKQKNSAAETELDPESLAHLTAKVYGDGLVSEESETYFKLHWHSHVNMGTFWSGTDNAMIQQLSQFGWHLFLVANKKREILCRYRDPKGCVTPFGYSELDIDRIVVTIEEAPNPAKEMWIKELEAVETKPTYTPTWNAHDNISSWEQEWDKDDYGYGYRRGFSRRQRKKLKKKTKEKLAMPYSSDSEEWLIDSKDFGWLKQAYDLTDVECQKAIGCDADMLEQCLVSGWTLSEAIMASKKG